MKRSVSIPLIIVPVVPVAFLAIACGTTGKKWSRVYPGMTGQEVVEVMEKGPSKVEPFNQDYAAWYYGKDRCLLLKEDKVVSKERTEEKGGIEVFGMGEAKARQRAECVPPGYAKKKGKEYEVETPFGTIKK